MTTRMSLMRDPEFREAFERLQELRQRYRDVDASVQEALAAGVGHSRKERVHAKAAVLVGASGAHELEEGPTPEEIAEIREERSVLAEAIRLQEKVVNDLRDKISREIVSGVRGDYKNIVKRLAAVLADLGRVADEEAAFRGRLDEGGVRYTHELRAPFPLEGFRRSVEHSKLNYWLGTIERDYGIRPPRS